MSKIKTVPAVSNRDFKGIWIPKEIWLNPDLTLMEKVFLVEINSLDNEKGCFASNEYFSKFFGITRQRASQIILNLKEKGFLKISYTTKKNSKEIEKRILKVGIKFSLHVSNKFSKGIKFSLGGYQENVEDNNTLSNNTFNNTDYNIGSAGTSTKKDTFLFNACKEYWLNEVHAGWTFDGVQGKALKSLTNKLQASIKNAGNDVNDSTTLDAFKILMQALPEWFRDKELTVLNSKYNEIINQIKNSKNGTTNSTGRQKQTTNKYRPDFSGSSK